MKSATNPKSNVTKMKMPPLAAIIVVVLVIVGVIWAGVAMYKQSSSSSSNFAQEAAGPLDEALTKAGGTKQCGRGNTGRGSDSNEPSYYAIYEVPGTREGATALVRKAALEAGFTLTDGALPADPQDNKFYSDHTSKASSYAELADGKVKLDIEVFGSKTYTGEGDQFCTVTKRENPPTDKTTIRYTINLPSFRR